MYDIDDLQHVVNENIKDRRQEAAKGERIVEEATVKFKHWHESLKVVPTIVALREKVETIIDAEIEHTLSSLNGISNRRAPSIGADENRPGEKGASSSHHFSEKKRLSGRSNRLPRRHP